MKIARLQELTDRLAGALGDVEITGVELKVGRSLLTYTVQAADPWKTAADFEAAFQDEHISPAVWADGTAVDLTIDTWADDDPGFRAAAKAGREWFRQIQYDYHNGRRENRWPTGENLPD